MQTLPISVHSAEETLVGDVAVVAPLLWQVCCSYLQACTPGAWVGSPVELCSPHQNFLSCLW